MIAAVMLSLVGRFARAEGRVEKESNPDDKIEDIEEIVEIVY